MDVASLLRLNIRRRGPGHVYADCPICGDRRGKMNMNLAKNVWRCNYCNEGGGMLALGIGLQNFPEGAAVSVPLRTEGYSRKRSFLLGQASGMVEPFAGILGALLVVRMEVLLPYALSFAAGAMILVAVHELIPECQRSRETPSYHATMGIVLGFAVMMLLDVVLG